MHLHLDAERKRTLQALFLTSAQIPALGIEEADPDATAVFRVAKEFSTALPCEETREVALGDVIRMLRFICWLLTYETHAPMKQFFASVVMQGQAQNSSFELLLRDAGIDRQLEMQMSQAGEFAESSSTRPRRPSKHMRMGQTTRTKQINIRVGVAGAELSSTTTESSWHAEGWKR